MKETTDEQVIEETLSRFPAKDESLLIPALQAVQQKIGYLPPEALRKVSKHTGVPLARAYGVVTFYTAFHLQPPGRHTLRVCMGTACHVRGAPGVLEEIKRLLEVEVGKTTTDGEFTLQTVNCLGCCAIGPIITIDDQYYGEMRADKVKSMLASIPS